MSLVCVPCMEGISEESFCGEGSAIERESKGGWRYCTGIEGGLCVAGVWRGVYGCDNTG